METLIIYGLTAAVFFITVWHLLGQRPQPPQIIYVQAAPSDSSNTGCLPLIILIAVILFALWLG